MENSISVVGCGHWGKNLVRNFYNLGALHSICDPDKTLSKKFSEEYVVPALSYNEILNNDSVKGIVLAVPAPLHSKMALLAFEHGKHVFVEKPLAMNELEANQMIKSSKDSKRHLMVGHLLQYHPIFIQLKEIVNNGGIGDIKYLYSNRLSFGKIRSEEDVLWSFAPHDLSMILSLAKKIPVSVLMQSSSILQNNIADISTLHLNFSNQLKAHISTSWLHPNKEQKLVVIGEKGMIIFDDTLAWKNKLAFYNHKINLEKPLEIQKAEVEYLDVKESEPLKNECNYFLDLIYNKADALTDGEEGLRVLKVLSAASLSEKNGELVFLNKND